MTILAGWAATAAAVLTVIGVVTLVAFFATGSSALGRANDVSSMMGSIATVPIALVRRPLASHASPLLANAAVGVEIIGVALVVLFSTPLILGRMTFEATLVPITLGNALVGVWVLVTAALLLTGGIVTVGLGLLGVAGGLGLTVAAGAFPALGREHPVVAVAGLVAVVGLVGFYAWAGQLLLRQELTSS